MRFRTARYCNADTAIARHARWSIKILTGVLPPQGFFLQDFFLQVVAKTLDVPSAFHVVVFFRHAGVQALEQLKQVTRGGLVSFHGAFASELRVDKHGELLRAARGVPPFRTYVLRR